jgi:hypothetical protein
MKEITQIQAMYYSTFMFLCEICGFHDDEN